MNSGGLKAPDARCEPGRVVAGNVYRKWSSRNPLVRFLMRRFEATLDALVSPREATSLLEVGCGEGEVTNRLSDLAPGARVVALDIDLPILRVSARKVEVPLLAASAEDLPFADDSFDLVVLCEVLEHLEDPARAVREAARVSRRHLVLTVPREPLWRTLNLLRGAYVGDLGNTPGHVQHWSRGAFLDFLGGLVEVQQVLNPVPWTAVLAEVRAGPAKDNEV